MAYSLTDRFTGPVKPFCPCDAGRPQDCDDRDWPGAHAPSSCTGCGRPNYQHGYSMGMACPQVDPK